MTHGTETRTWRQKTPYQPKPYAGQNLSPTRGDKGFYENWMDRMAEQMTRVVVHLSTNTGGESWDQFELGGDEAHAFNKAVKHMKFKRQFGVLPQGVYTITVPGTDRKHSFEVE